MTVVMIIVEKRLSHVMGTSRDCFYRDSIVSWISSPHPRNMVNDICGEGTLPWKSSWMHVICSRLFLTSRSVWLHQCSDGQYHETMRQVETTSVLHVYFDRHYKLSAYSWCPTSNQIAGSPNKKELIQLSIINCVQLRVPLLSNMGWLLRWI